MAGRSDLAVILATHNGADVLPRVLDGYLRVAPPDDPWRLVVVDNASTDATPTILDRYRTRLPLDVLREPVAGKNRALNRALATTGADLAIFTDDDAVPDPGFLCAWQAVARARPGCALFGGRVEPLFEHAPPRWLEASRHRYAELYALNDRTEGPIAARDIFGPNMAVRQSIFAVGFAFDTDIGPNRRPDYAMGSETEFCTRVERLHGAHAWFARDAVVRHIVRDWQMTPQFFAGRAYRHGRGLARQVLARGDVSDPRRAALGGSVRSALHALFMPLLSRTRRQDARWQHHWWRGYRDEARAWAGTANR